ncbi:peptide ABC transporter substrate-binding protein [Aureimonas endophytica]|uniref:Peptide ABC transporter substrate-binding protein n=1 Tax=Aureimonas endophytica TaxID=2027858 RepID=A0A916ZVM4_9HYPH|nr:ABC transporter substrate-binding protein [Aureimonas endophytica]GGE15924.1 peptide ABC transporter substrate-binding protein [Aureimonas endophytica]
MMQALSFGPAFRRGALALGLLLGVAPAWGAEMIEPPVLKEDVAGGKLPPVAERIPAEPLVVDLAAEGKRVGDYGGSLRMIEGQAKDTRRMVVYGYARLVGYTPDQKLQPDIAKAVDVEDERVFTFHLRRGHKWSDGEPFTADDFRYWWEDVIGNKQLTPFGPPREMLVDGEPPKVSFIDAETIRYEWSKPNPFFLPAIAGPQPLYIYRPAHYLKKYHAKYVDAEKLAQKVKDAGQRDWVALHFKYDQMYKNSDPKLPSLEPFVLRTKPPSDRFVFARNPYFHRIDTAGHQLPYLDEVAMAIASSKLIPAKTGAGEADLQASYLVFNNYAFLRQAARNRDFDVRRWASGKGSKITLYPNLNAKDEVWRKLFQNVDFRRALSLGMNREDINQAIFYGLGKPVIDTAQEGSPLYDAARAARYAAYDPDEANRLLDSIGLTEKESGVRLLPDGRQMIIVVETAGEDTEQVDVLGLIAEDYRKIGIKLLIKPSERDTLSSRLAAGSTLMSVWTGLENGLPTPDWSPAQLAPTNGEQPEWPNWGSHFETKGTMGTAPDLPVAQKLLDLNRRWTFSSDEGERTAIWKEMLDINADEALRIGIVSGIDNIVVVSKKLQNVPDRGVYNWNPGAFFGTYRMETFFFGEPDQRQAAMP